MVIFAGASKTLTQEAIAHGMAVLPEGNLIMADWSRRGITISTANGKMIKTFEQDTRTLEGQSLQLSVCISEQYLTDTLSPHSHL